jgi:hypothetical protein
MCSFENGTFLNSIDKHFRIEMKFFASAIGQLGIKRVQAMILQSLPTETHLMDPL